jgi:hypothetical protein
VDVAHAPIVSALRATAAQIDRELEGQSSLTLALTNGRQLYALQRGLPLAWAERDGLPRRDSDRPGEKRPERIDVHYVSVASCGRDAAPQGYTKLHDGDIACIDRDLKLTIEQG